MSSTLVGVGCAHADRQLKAHTGALASSLAVSVKSKANIATKLAGTELRTSTRRPDHTRAERPGRAGPGGSVELDWTIEQGITMDHVSSAVRLTTYDAADRRSGAPTDSGRSGARLGLRARGLVPLMARGGHSTCTRK